MKCPRILIALLAIALLVPLSAALAEEASVWSYDYNNAYLSCTGELSGDVVIPGEVDGFAVNAIRYNAFYGQNDVTALTMPDTLRALQNNAINDMGALSSVTLNEGLEFIDYNFNRCGALTSLTIPASVRVVRGIVSFCDNMKEIRFEGPCPLVLDAQWCFSMLPEDYTIYVPDDQLDAYAEALAEANGAAEHLQPSGKNAVIPEAQDTQDWFDFDAETGTITGYREYQAYLEIPETIHGVAVKAIGEGAFRSDYSVYAVEFPEGLERIEAGAFRSASNLAYISLPESLRTIEDEAFLNAQILQIDWSEGLETIGARAFQYDAECILTLPDSLKTIGESAFEMASCEELYLGGNVESIGSRAFADSSLYYIVFDLYQPIDIAADAFVDTYIEDLDLPWDSSIENRDAYAEMLKDQCPDCTVWINNPESGGVAEYPINEIEITTIENGVWTAYNGDQSDLTIWTSYDDIDVTALGEGLFRGNQSIRSFYPHHCGWFTTIGNEAFADSSVEYVELFASITTIGDGAFRNCVNITELALPDSLTSLGAGALEGCTGISELTLPDSLSSLGAGALKGCTGITELTLPASLTNIGAGALEGCTGLKKLVVLCDPALLPEDLVNMLADIEEVYAAPDATSAQVQALSALVGRPWYDPLPRLSEQSHYTVMPFDPLPGDDFWYDEEYARIDAYQGYELNLVLPREIDGVQLTMIGGGLMNRASNGDNYELELPVRSLVIPENYTEIPGFAFWDCDTLETFVCYAPIENLAEGTFNGCTSLREVIFVNGVRNIERYVFDSCDSLETVYIGPYTESIDENAFRNSDGDDFFSLDRCITDPAQLPDVDALLSAVESAPMEAPDEEEEEEERAAVPVGDEGASYFGIWIGVSMEMDGDSFSFSDFDMTMNLSLNPDGTAVLFDGESEDVSVWGVADGAAYIDSMALTLVDDDTLCYEEDGTKMYFEREGAQGASTAPEVGTAEPEAGTTMPEVGAAEPEAQAPAAESGEPEAPVSDGIDMADRMETKYVMESAEVQGYTMTPEQLGGLAYALAFHADGSVEFTMAGTEVPGLTWTQVTAQTDAGEAQACIIDYYGTPLSAVLTQTGFDMNYFDSMIIHFAPEM